MQEEKLGKLIVIEGASDGIGKTTQYNLLREHLKSDGVKITTHHFPTYYAYQGKAVEMYLAGKYGQPENLSPYFINNLYATDRAITWQTKLKSAYEKGHTILLDRYTTSSQIYQSALFETEKAKRAFLDYVDDFEYTKLGIQKPDVVFFLYAPLELVNAMRSSRKENEGNIKNDIHEHDLAYLQKVYDNSIFVAQHLGWTMINCADKTSQKMRTPEDIHREIYQMLTTEK